MNTDDRMPANPPPESRLGLFLAALLRGLLRLLIIAIVLGGLAAVIYFGAPALYRGFIAPVEENAERLDSFQAGQEQANRQLTQRLDRLQGELAALQTQSAEDTQANAALRKQWEEAQKTLSGRLDTAGSELADGLDRLQAFDESLGQVHLGLDRLAAAQKTESALLKGLDDRKQATAQAADLSTGRSLDNLRREIELIKAMELMLRSRLFLGQSNFGLARQDVQSARDLLVALRGQVPVYQAEALDAILARLDRVLENLPERPVIAADDLEIAWQLVVLGLPGEFTPTATPLLSATETLSTTATVDLEITTPLPATGTVESSITPTADLETAPVPSRTPAPTSSPSPTP